jgi:competence ComEA-like helix-hairpin-helix protein
MKTKNKQSPAHKDRRLAVLVSLVLIILAAAAAPNITRHLPSLFSPDLQPPTKLIWLEGQGIESGIYQIPPATTYGQLYEQAGIAIQKSPELDPDLLVEQYASVTLTQDKPLTTSTINPTLAPLVFQPLPINRADAKQLATIPGIGPKLARRIIKLRNKKKKFTSLDQLIEVKGIGRKKLGMLKKAVVLD